MTRNTWNADVVWANQNGIRLHDEDPITTDGIVTPAITFGENLFFTAVGLLIGCGCAALVIAGLVRWLW